MKRSRGRVVHVESLADLDRRLAAGATSLRGWRVRGVDLTDRQGALAAVSVAGATFLGCRFAPGDEDRLQEAGALVLEVPADLPVEPRSTLYAPEELYDTARYADSLDALAYAWSQRPATAAPRSAARCTTTPSTSRWRRGSRAGTWSG